VAAPFSPITLEKATEADITFNGAVADDQSGFVVTSHGDINGDSANDVAIGAENAGNACATGPACPRGEVRVVMGGPTSGGVLELTASDLVVTGTNPGDRLGTAVANAGDLDGDGFGDLVVGARQADRVYPPPVNTGNEGQVYVFFSRPTFASPLTAAGADLTISGSSLSGEAGSYLATDADLSGDGLKACGSARPKSTVATARPTFCSAARRGRPAVPRPARSTSQPKPT
jgi:hypothetical protein